MVSTMKEKNIVKEFLGDVIEATRLPVVYVIQEIAGTRDGRPKINILGAAEYGSFRFLLPELSQMIFSPGSIVSDITNGKYKLLKWDKQERKYYPIDINLYEKGKIDE